MKVVSISQKMEKEKKKEEKSICQCVSEANQESRTTQKHLIKYMIVAMLVITLVTFLMFMSSRKSQEQNTSWYEIVHLNLRFYRRIKHIALHEKYSLRSPRDIAQIAREVYSMVHIESSFYYLVLLYLCVLYLLLQSFCLPGTIILNVIAGTLLGVFDGVLLCTILGTLGAMNCYALSYFLGEKVVCWLDHKLLKGNGVKTLRSKVHEYREELFVYLLFLRLTPLLPNWLINLASPIVRIPLYTFVTATLLGILPQTFLAVRFGAVLQPPLPPYNNNNVKQLPNHDNNSIIDSNVNTNNDTNNVKWDVKFNNNNIIKVSDALLIAVLAVTILFVFKLKRRYTNAST